MQKRKRKSNGRKLRKEIFSFTIDPQIIDLFDKKIGNQSRSLCLEQLISDNLEKNVVGSHPDTKTKKPKVTKLGGLHK